MILVLVTRGGRRSIRVEVVGIPRLELVKLGLVVAGVAGVAVRSGGGNGGSGARAVIVTASSLASRAKPFRVACGQP